MTCAAACIRVLWLGGIADAVLESCHTRRGTTSNSTFGGCAGPSSVGNKDTQGGWIPETTR